MDFWYLVRVLRARQWVVLGSVIITLVVILIAAPRPRVVYEASAYMLPTPQVMQGGTSTTKGIPTNSPNREVVLSNLVTLAQSGDVYQRALDFLALPSAEQKKLAPGLPSYKQINRVEIEPGILLRYKDWPDVLEVTPVVNRAVGSNGTMTDIICITVQLPNGNAAPYLANSIAQAFSASYRDKSRHDTRTYANFLASAMKEARTRLHNLQIQIEARKSRHHVVSMDRQMQSEIASMAVLDTQKNAAEAAVREAQAAVTDVEMQLAREPLVRQAHLPAEMNPIVKKLKEELSNAESDLRTLSLRYKPEHEVYKAMQARIATLKDRIKKEGATFPAPTINDVHQDLLKKRSEAQFSLAKAKARLVSVTASARQAQAKIGDLGQLEPELGDLTRDYMIAERDYNALSDKYSQVLMAEQETTKTGSITSFGWALAATGPIVIGPTKKSLMAYGFVLSLILGIAAAVLIESIDNRMRNAADIEKVMQLPVIGLVPQLAGREKSLPRLTHLYPLSAIAESYKILRTNVLFALREHPFQTLMVATGRPGQGATTTVCNLAIALAQFGKRVILIDADMRRPSLHQFFGIRNDAGLSTLLNGVTPLAEAFQTTDVANLLVVPAGPPPVNPSELLGSDRMRDMVSQLKEHCDLVLFDSPSTVVFSDGPMLASWIEAVFMVVSANQAPRGTEVQTRDLLRKADANIIGVVANRMPPDKVDSCYFHSRYYLDSDAPPSVSSRHGAVSKARDSLRTERMNNQDIVDSEGGYRQAEIIAAGEDNDDNPLPD